MIKEFMLCFSIAIIIVVISVPLFFFWYPLVEYSFEYWRTK